MTAEHPYTTHGCLEIRTRMKDYVDEKLGDAERNIVADHIDACDDCHEAYLRVLVDETPLAEPLLPAPRIPPMDLYDAYLRARSSESGATTPWVSIRNGRDAVDKRVKDWASDRLEQIRKWFETAVDQMEMTPRVVTLRVAADTPLVEASLLTPDGQSTGTIVPLRVLEAPAILKTGHFRVHVSAPPEYERHLVECALQLGDLRLSFVGEFRRSATACEAIIDEAGVVRAPRRALEHLSAVFTVRPLPGQV